MSRTPWEQFFIEKIKKIFTEKNQLLILVGASESLRKKTIVMTQAGNGLGTI